MLLKSLFMTCSWLVHKLVNDLFMSCFQLVHNLFMNCSWLVHQLVHDLFTTCLQLVYNLFTTCSWLVHDFFINFTLGHTDWRILKFENVWMLDFMAQQSLVPKLVKCFHLQTGDKVPRPSNSHKQCLRPWL